MATSMIMLSSENIILFIFILLANTNYLVL
jgi:hypothetical protein